MFKELRRIAGNDLREERLEKHSIQVNIFGRQFPALVDKDEAAVIKEAAKIINAKLRAFKTEYRTQDDVDIAIMCCLDITTEYLKQKLLDDKKEKEIIQQIDQLDKKLSSASKRA
ncbi:MAG: cell division protein ZapA [Bacteroidota bacterium]